jgi:phenylacetate-coenzyme A ligase PaaK-like adenylate-forming protein
MVQLKKILNKYPRVKQLARKMVSVVPLSKRLGRSFWEWYAFFEESEKWSTTELSQFQIQRIRSLLWELIRTSIFYRERFDGTDINSIVSLDEFREKIPSISKNELRHNYTQILNASWPNIRAIPTKTSGTTGSPLQFYHRADDESREWAAICHQWKRVGYDPSKSRRAEFRGLTSSNNLIDVYPEQNKLRCSIIHMKPEHVRRYGEAIRRYNVDFYSGYPSAIYLLAKEISSAVPDFPQPRAILLASETVYDWQLDQIHSAFPSAKLFAHYGCSERTVLAGWCEHRNEYHVLPQYAFVEVDPASSEVIGTNLYNDINGFVRYRMTDTATCASVESCKACGRAYIPLLSKLGGRIEDYLYSPRNGWIPPAIVTYPLKGLKNIGETQFFQNERNCLVVRYTVSPRGGDFQLQDDLRRIAAGIYDLFGRDMKIRFDRVEGFPRGSSGKFKWIVSELEAPISR